MNEGTRVTISGWGSVINIELAIIKNALESYGFKVDVINDAPKDYSSHKEGLGGPRNEKEWLEYTKMLNTQRPGRKVHITMDHWPWPG